MSALLILHFMVGLVLAQTSFVDPDYISSVDSIECNKIFPFAFDSPGTGTSIVAWDLQNFSDNYQQFFNSDSNYAVTKESYVAVCYRDSFGLSCGVTYQLERTFKWIRQITDAHPSGKAAIKTSTSFIESAPSTSQIFDSSNDSRVYVSYEAIDQSTVVFVSFNYLTGAIENVYRIHKGVTELANTMIMQHIMGAAVLDGGSDTSTTVAVVSIVMSYNSGNAFEIQMSNSGMKNPVPYRVFDYKSKHSASTASASGFENNNFSKVIGISAKSRMLHIGIGQSDVIQLLYTLPSMHVKEAVYSMQKRDQSYNYWVFSATAFLTVDASNQNTVWWYVSRKFQNVQQISEISYTFQSVGGPLTSYVVSPDAPQMCMTSSYGLSSYIYIDDIARAAVQPQYLLNNGPNLCSDWSGPGSTCVAYRYRNYNVDFTQSELPIGLKQYKVDKEVVCLAINTQMQTVSNTQGINDVDDTLYTVCKAFTTILLEQKGTGTVHIVQLTFRRSQTQNDLYFKQQTTDGIWTYLPKYSCLQQFEADSSLDDFPSTSSFYKQYSFKVKSPIPGQYQFFSKGFVNFGIKMSWGPEPMPENSGFQQDLSFYVADVQGKKVSFDTNNLNLRCQSLTSDSQFDLALSNYPNVADNQAISHNVQNPVYPYRYVDGASSLYQSLTQGTAPLMPLKYLSLTTADATFLKKVTDPTLDIEYDYTVCQRPKTFGLDPVVQKGLLCLQINTNLTQNTMNTQGANLIGLRSQISKMDFNMWPYSNCWDRSTDTKNPTNNTQKPAKQLFSSFFNGFIGNSKQVIQKVQTNTIQFTVNSASWSIETDDYLQIKFDAKAPGTLGLQPGALQMTYKIGADATNVTWDQRTMFQLSCQPTDFVWQTIQDNRRFPLQVTYFYGQGKIEIGLPQAVPTNKQTKYNVDQYQYLAYNYQVLFTSNVTGPTTAALANVIIKNQAFVIEEDVGEQQWLMLGAIVTGIEPYYYVKNSNGRVQQDRIKFSLTQIVNVTFVNNQAPYFFEPLENVQLAINDTVVVKLPEIIDPDSSLAFIRRIQVFPIASFLVLQNTKQKTGSYITLKPTKSSHSGTYFCTIYLLDVSVTPRQSAFQFEFQVLESIQQTNTTAFIPTNKTDEITFKPESRIGVKVDKAFTNLTICLKFNLPMKLYINPTFTVNSNYTTNVTTVLSSYLKLQHKQKDLYSQELKTMKDPSFKVISYDGLYLFLLIEFSDLSLLSQSKTESEDQIYLRFSQTKAFLSQNNLISTYDEWQVNFVLPVQIQSGGQSIKSTAQLVSRSVTGFMTANFVINLLMSTSLQKMWGNLNVLQLVVATPLLQVNLPQNVFALCEALLSVTQFQLFDSTSLTSKIFGIQNFSPETLKPLNDRLSEGGYQQTNFIYNLGCLFYICVVLVFFVLVASLLTGLNRVFRMKSLQLLLGLIWGWLTPSLYIRLFFEMNFELGISSYIQIKRFRSITTGVDLFSNILAVTGAVVTFLAPLISAIVIVKLKNLDLLRDRKMQNTFGALYQMQLVPRPTLHHLLYNVFFMMRRVATIVCIFYMARVPSFQIGCMMWMTTFWMGYALSVKPFEDPALNMLEVNNELFYNLILLLCFTFTELLQDVGAKTETGYAFIALLLTLLAINIGVQLKDTFKLIVLKMKRNWMLYKQRQKKWRKPSNLRLSSQAFSNKASVQEILNNQYKARVYQDVVGQLKQNFFNALQPKSNLDQQLENKSQLVTVKTKPATRTATQIKPQERPNLPVQRKQKADRTYEVGDIVQLSSLSDLSESSDLSDKAIVERYMLELESEKEDITNQASEQIQNNQRQQKLPQDQVSQKRNQNLLQSRNTKEDGNMRIKIKDETFKPPQGMTLWDYVLLKQAEEQASNQKGAMLKDF